MPAVVRGGRRTNSSPQRSRPQSRASSRPAGGAKSRRPEVPGKLAALSSLDLSPRAAAIGLGVVAMVCAGIIFTGSRAERLSAFVSGGINQQLAAAGLQLRRVHIQGASSEANRAIQQVLTLRQGEAITGVDLDLVRQQVEAVGWVEKARVVRLLPDTLVIAVTEHDRLAVWQTGGRNAVIDSQGRVIEGADAALYPELPLVVGEGAHLQATEVIRSLSERPDLMRRVEAIVRVDGRRWDLRLRDGSLILLPEANVDAALIQLEALDQRQGLLGRGFERVDLRLPEAVVVRPRGTG